MTVIIISIVAAWILFSALLVTIICMNSSRLSRIDEPFKDPAELAQERMEKREEYAQSAVQIGAET
jgi:CBS domain containing-hemolysin-like protein